MASAFSAPDAAIITHQPDLDEALLAGTAAQTGRSIEDLYDIESTATKIVEGKYERVALQFPDEGLPDSVPIFWELRKSIDAQLEKVEDGREGRPKPDLYILADTSYGNCCVDEVAAQHVDADVVVHYGHACLSPTARLPVIYVFHKREINVVEAAESLASGALETIEKWDGAPRHAIVVSYDVGYAHAAQEVHDGIAARLRTSASGSRSGSQWPQLVLSKLDTAKNAESKISAPEVQGEGSSTASSACKNEAGCCQSNDDKSGCADGTCPSQVALPRLPTQTQSIDALAGSDGSGRQYALPAGSSLEDCLILYIGGESLALTNLLLRAGPSCPVVSFDPHDASRGSRREDGKTNRLLMRRYAAVQKARDASVVGLLVGTLGVQSYLPLLAHLRQLLSGRRPGAKKSTTRGGQGRKVYTISVGKLSPAKLANFQEIDIFVLLACPENSLVDAVDPTGSRSKEFYKPIVTPYEMMLALDESRSWTGSYVLEMNRLAEEAAQADAGPQKEDDGDGSGDDSEDELDGGRPHFSLVTGGYVSRQKYESHRFGEEPKHITEADANDPANQSSVILKDATSGQMTRILDSASALHLSGRSWRGLEQRLGMDEPSVLEEGRAGIARQYAEADGTKEG